MSITNDHIDAIVLAIDENSTVEFPVEGLAQHATTVTDYEPIRDAVAEVVRAENDKLLSALAAISNMCVGEMAMGYKLDAQCIGQLIYEATGLTNPQLNELEKHK